MTTRRFVGGAASATHVKTLTPSNPQVGDVFTITIGTKAISYTVVAADLADETEDGLGGTEATAIANVCDGLYALLSVSTIPEFFEITWADATTHLTATAKTAGKPIELTLTSTGDGSAADEVQTLTLTGASSGNITLTHGIITTGNIAYNASAATINTALDAAFGAGQIVATGGDLNTSPVTLTFSGATYDELNVAQMIANDVSLDAGTLTLTTATQGASAADDFVAADTTANSGPNDWATAANWSPAAVPVNSDDVVLDGSAVYDILYGLGQSAVTLASLTLDETFSKLLGLPEISEDQAGTDYPEHRTKDLEIGATLLTVRGTSSRVNINLGTVQTTGLIDHAGVVTNTPADEPVVKIKGTNASNSFATVKGFVGFAWRPGETATLATLNVGYKENKSGDATVVCGSGVTHTTVNQSGGSLYTAANVTTANITGGTWYRDGGTCTTINVISGGHVIDRSTGTITTLNDGAKGRWDRRQDLRAVTITNTNLYGGCAYNDPAGVATNTNGYDFVQCRPDDIEFDVPRHRTLTPSSI